VLDEEAIAVGPRILRAGDGEAQAKWAAAVRAAWNAPSLLEVGIACLELFGERSPGDLGRTTRAQAGRPSDEG
jgi:hypothetical protein